MENENLAVDLGLLEILKATWILCLLLSRHEPRSLNAIDMPVRVIDPIAGNCLRLTLCVSQHPTIHYRAGIPPSLRVRLLRLNLELKKEHGHGAKSLNV